MTSLSTLQTFMEGLLCAGYRVKEVDPVMKADPNPAS